MLNILIYNIQNCPRFVVVVTFFFFFFYQRQFNQLFHMRLLWKKKNLKEKHVERSSEV